MSRFWSQLKIKSKIIYPVVLISILTGLVSYFYVKDMYKESNIETLVGKAQSLVTEAEGVREYASENHKLGVYKETLTSKEDILRTIPIINAMEVLNSRSSELGLEFKVPKVNPRNAKNAPDKYELEMLAKLKNENLKEFWSVDDETNKLRYFRPIELTEDCLRCHGDPTKSMEYWGNSNGLDITGSRMEGWETGEMHGAFELQMDMQPVYAAVNKKSFYIALIFGLSTFAIILVMYFVAEKISNRINKLKNAANQMAEGRDDIVIPVESKDEIGELATDFNTMIEKIQESKQALREEKAGVEQKVEEAVKESEERKIYLEKSVGNLLTHMDKLSEGDLSLNIKVETDDEMGRLYEGFNTVVKSIRRMIESVSEAVEATASASHEISSSAEEMAAGTQEQSSQTSEMASGIEQMAKTILNNSQNAKVANDSAKDANDLAKEGFSKIIENKKAIEQIISASQTTGERISSLAGRTNQIGEITQVIEEIADQTNLLALNAAIEAARAGEQGRGFAVVADEVRKLAERTSKATKEIAHTISLTQQEAQQANASMQDAEVSVNSGKNVTEELRLLLEQIVTSAENVSVQIEQVATASEEQSSTVEQIGRNIEAINNVSQESAEGTRQIARASEDLSQLTIRLQDLVSQFKLTEHNTQAGYSVRTNGSLMHS